MRTEKPVGILFPPPPSVGKVLRDYRLTLQTLRAESEVTTETEARYVKLLESIASEYKRASSLDYKVAALFLLADAYAALAQCEENKGAFANAFDAIRGARESLEKAEKISVGKKFNEEIIKSLNTRGMSDCKIAIETLDNLLDDLVKRTEETEASHRLIKGAQ
jgi:hypothetical protein